MSGIHLFGRLEAPLSLTTKIASRIPTSGPIKKSWYIRTALFRVQDTTIRLNRPTCEDVEELAKELGVTRRCLYKWRAKLDLAETAEELAPQASTQEPGTETGVEESCSR